MSIKSLAQIIIILIIFIIIGSVYYNYFYKPVEIQKNFKNNIEKKVIEEKTEKLNKSDKVKNNQIKKSEDNNQIKTKEKNLEKEVEKPKEEVEKPKEEVEKPKEEVEKPKEEVVIKTKEEPKDDTINKKNNLETTNVLTEVEYLTTDNKGNKYKIFAKSAKTSKENKDILELDQVRGIVTSETRSNVYIVSDFAKYNSSNLSSLFYQNVVINFEDKQIDCDYFDLDMQTNIAVAYSNVIVTDPKSIMKAGRITLDMKTKDINIEPEVRKKIEVKTN